MTLKIKISVANDDSSSELKPYDWNSFHIFKYSSCCFILEDNQTADYYPFNWVVLTYLKGFEILMVQDFSNHKEKYEHFSQVLNYFLQRVANTLLVIHEAFVLPQSSIVAMENNCI